MKSEYFVSFLKMEYNFILFFCAYQIEWVVF